MSVILHWLVLSLAVYVTAQLLPGFHIRKPASVLLIAALFGLLNWLLGWLLFVVFSIATLGIGYLLAFITRWIINAILLVLVDRLTDHLKIDGFKWALAGALVMSLIGTIAQWLLGHLMGGGETLTAMLGG